MEPDNHAAYRATLFNALQDRANPRSKAWWEGYVKESAPFLGVKMADIRALVHRWYSDHGISSLEPGPQLDLALSLFEGQYTEEKLAGILFLQEILLPAGTITCARDAGRFAELFQKQQIYDWNVCDWFCVKVLGPLIEQEGRDCAARLAAWHTAENLWQARASLVAFVPVAENAAYYPLVEQACTAVIRRPERFAKTAVGWLLREISRHDKAFVDRLVRENIAYFSLESLKNATKYYDKEEIKVYKQLLRDA